MWEFRSSCLTLPELLCHLLYRQSVKYRWRPKWWTEGGTRGSRHPFISRDWKDDTLEPICLLDVRRVQSDRFWTHITVRTSQESIVLGIRSTIRRYWVFQEQEKGIERESKEANERNVLSDVGGDRRWASRVLQEEFIKKSHPPSRRTAWFFALPSLSLHTHLPSFISTSFRRESDQEESRWRRWWRPSLS